MKRKLTLFVMILVLLVICSIPTVGEEKEKIELKPVLLVMDVQNIWLPMMDEENRDAAQNNINEIIALFREYNHPVVRVYHSEPDYGPEPGTEQFEFPETIDIRDDDPMIVKNHASAFTKTDLEKILREKDRNTLFICGLSATGCALATYYGGLEREFMTLMVEGTLLSQNTSYTRAVEDFCRSVTIAELRETFKDPGK